MDYFGSDTTQQNSPQPLGVSVFENMPRHLIYIKNAIANQRKKGNLLDSAFEGDNLALTTEEYDKKLNEQMAPETATKLVEQTAHMNHDEFRSVLNQLREQVNLQPLPPDLPQLQNPSWQQSAAAALTALFSPEHAFEAASVPFQYQKQQQMQQHQQNLLGYEAQMNQHNQLMKLGGAELDHAADSSSRQFQADYGREMFAKETNENRQQAVDGRNFNREQIDKQMKFEWNKLEAQQKFAVAGALIDQALNPTIGADARQSAAAQLAGFGIDIRAFEGKTLQEQGTELQMQIQRDDNKRAWNQEGRTQEIFPLQKEGIQIQNKADRIKLEYLPQQLQAQLDETRAGIDNINDMIRSRREGDTFNLSEQDRAYIGMQQDNARSAMSGLTSTLESLGVEERAIDKERLTATPTRQKEIDDRKAKIQEQKGQIYDELGTLNSQLKEIDGVLKSHSGSSGGTGSGDWGADALGTAYSWGGGDTRGAGYGDGKGKNTKGFDCSGFVQYAISKELGVDIGGTCAAQWGSNKLETLKDPSTAQTGDLLYWRKGNQWHTALLLFRDGEAWIRHAPQTGDVVKDQKLSEFKTSKTFLGVRRVKKPQKKAEQGAVVDLGQFFTNPLGGE